MSSPNSSLLRRVGVLVALLAVAAAGLWAGRFVAGPPRVIEPHAPKVAFAPGDRFPSVRVLDETGRPRTTGELVEGRGAVVLFLDFDCSPCATMVSTWNDQLKSDSLGGTRVIGVTVSPPAAVRDYRVSHGVTFPVYSDTAASFVKEHGVEDMPLCLAVDARSTVRWSTFDPQAPVPARELAGWVSK